MTKATAYRLILCILILLTVAFIFSNSLQPSEASKEDSDRVTGWLRPLFSLLLGEGNVTEKLIRKLAHFAEFALLGAELGLLLGTLGLTAPLFSLLVALSDETLQLFSSGRGAQVQDVWLDFSGAMCGYLFALGLLWLLRRKKATAEKEKATP